MNYKKILLAAAALTLPAMAWAQGDQLTRSYAIAEFGEPRVDIQNTTHFPWANPDAPKGGTVRLTATDATFDTLNPNSSSDTYPYLISLTGDSLYEQTIPDNEGYTDDFDEIGVAYPLIAEYVEYPADMSYAVFKINDAARYHDGSPILAGDFKFAFDKLMECGQPFAQSFFENVASVEAPDDQHVRVNFKTTDSMKNIVAAGSLGPSSQVYWDASTADRDLCKATLVPPLSEGPYKITNVESGKSLTFERVPDYWAADLPVRKGLFNFDRIVIDYYADRDVALEAFKAGDSDFRREYTSRLWATAYDFPAANEGRVIKDQVPVSSPAGPYGFYYNQRNPLFQDAKVREALNLLYPFEYVQKNLMFGFYDRNDSFFRNSEYGAGGKEPTPRELEILEEFRGQVPDQVFTTVYVAPQNGETGVTRENLRKALGLFGEAGWEVKDGKLVNAAGEPFKFTILLGSPGLEKHTLAWTEELKKAGIESDVQIVDRANYSERLDNFDYDVISYSFSFFPPPGPELLTRYGSEAADEKESPAYMGIKNPVVDALLERIVVEKDQEELANLSRALDRVLMWNHYHMPAWGNNEAWLAYWNKFGYPEQNPPHSVGFWSWWVDPTLDANLKK